MCSARLCHSWIFGLGVELLILSIQKSEILAIRSKLLSEQDPGEHTVTGIRYYN